MLEFYLDLDEQPTAVHALVRSGPVDRIRSIELGGIDVEPFHRLSELWEKLARDGIVVNYFDDCSFTRGEVATIARALAEFRPLIGSKSQLDAFEVMKRIVESASLQGAGLVAITD